MKKSTSQSARALIALLFCAAACSIVTGTLPGFVHSGASANVSQRTLTFAERVAYQRATEDVYWRHRIWPKERPDPKPSLDAVMSQAQVEKKVTDYLRKSQALEDYWQRPITAEQLQAEMDRMAQHTKQPQVLRELFASLGNDPFVIAECLARPALAERLLTNWYAHDQRIHGELKERAEAELQTNNNVEQMKQLSGRYTEIELTKSDSAHPQGNRAAERSVKVDNHEWDETVQKLAAMFNDGSLAAEPTLSTSRTGVPPVKDAPITQIKTGVVSRLQEDETHYYATAIVEKNNDHLKLANVTWLKEPLASWLARAEIQLASSITLQSDKYKLPGLAGGDCVDDTWTATAGPPDIRYGQTGVWTGTEMIIWGGGYGFYPYLHFRNTGTRYNPSTDTWTTTSTIDAPTGRVAHTAVWTGSEMIVWGGAEGLFSVTNTGGRYNPNTDAWTATSTADAPAARGGHTAIWTGNEMIVWGGNPLNSGGRYNPITNSWTATSTTNAPTGRSHHTAVWTGSEMIVWGGADDTSVLNTGGKYNPSTNSWIATSTTNAPAAREAHAAIWSGNEMIVWGGRDSTQYFNTGGRYNPGTNSWIATSTTNAPTARSDHTAVWTGSQMIVWGGWGGVSNFNTGGRYNPAANSWTATSTSNAPAGRADHTAVWSGTEMIVWGGGGDFGYFNDGGRYNPTANSWTSTNTYNVPEARGSHAAVWTGSEMIVWGGSAYPNYLNNGGRYDPAIDTWTDTSINNAPSGRGMHTAVWTGSQMIIWGGQGENFVELNTGGRYNPATNGWAATATANAPTPRELHTAIWTGGKMIVWGGWDGFNDLNTGGLYDPTTNTWTVVGTTGPPIAREAHSAVWTGNEMIIWGGWNFDSQSNLNTGGRYNPATNSWTATETSNAPAGRSNHTAVWTGSEMIVWSGSGLDISNTGGRYDAAAHTWTATSTTNAPDGRYSHTAVWTSNEMIVWGGAYFDPNNFANVPLNTGGRYSPGTDSWTATNLTSAPDARYTHTAVWTGNEMIVWGGGYLNTGGRYCAQSGPPSTPTPTPTATATPTPTATPTSTASPTPTPTPCTGRCTPTPRPRPTPAPRP
jgi:N-acetylneuraminic acid mutarotase